MKIAILLFDEITLLDAIGPYEVLGKLPGAELLYVGKRAGKVVSDQGLALLADHAIHDVSAADLLLVPGGFGARHAQADEELKSWLRAIDATTRITASVCTGSILLASAGLLQGRRATTHWAFYSQLVVHGVTAVAERVVRDGKYATAAGVSAGIDLGLQLAIDLVGREVAERIQLAIEYDPAPPLDAGSPTKARAEIREHVMERMHARDLEIAAAMKG